MLLTENMVLSSELHMTVFFSPAFFPKYKSAGDWDWFSSPNECFSLSSSFWMPSSSFQIAASNMRCTLTWLPTSQRVNSASNFTSTFLSFVLRISSVSEIYAMLLLQTRQDGRCRPFFLSSSASRVPFMMFILIQFS